MDAPTEVTRWDGRTCRGISITLSIAFVVWRGQAPLNIWTCSSSEKYAFGGMFPRIICLSSLLFLLTMTRTPHFHALAHGNRWTAGSTVITAIGFHSVLLRTCKESIIPRVAWFKRFRFYNSQLGKRHISSFPGETSWRRFLWTPLPRFPLFTSRTFIDFHFKKNEKKTMLFLLFFSLYNVELVIFTERMLYISNAIKLHRFHFLYWRSSSSLPAKLSIFSTGQRHSWEPPNPLTSPRRFSWKNR